MAYTCRLKITFDRFVSNVKREKHTHTHTRTKNPERFGFGRQSVAFASIASARPQTIFGSFECPFLVLHCTNAFRYFEIFKNIVVSSYICIIQLSLKNQVFQTLIGSLKHVSLYLETKIIFLWSNTLNK